MPDDEPVESTEFEGDDGKVRSFARGGTDHEQAEWIGRELDHSIRYNYALKSWHVWNGLIWAPDKTKDAQDRVYSLVRRRLQQLALAPNMGERRRAAAMKITRRLLDRSRCDSAMDVLATFPDYKTSGEDWDQVPWLLGCANGILDLRTGELDEHPKPDCLVTKTTGLMYRPTAQAPRFLQFLDEIASGDSDLWSFYLIWFGYSLFGLTEEQKFLILSGVGRNGKGALVTVIRKVFGDYAAPASPALYMKNRWGSARSNEARGDLIDLKGARIAIMSEPEGGEFNEEMLKAHTGGDPITARPLYGTQISWLPTHSITFLTNRPPAVDDIGPAMRERIMVADFRERYEGANEDKRLYDKLLAESEGVLALLATAARLWWESRENGGLRLPERVKAASAAYISANDPLGRAMAEAFVTGDGSQTRAKELYDAYIAWYKGADDPEPMLSSTAFSLLLGSRGFTRIRKSTGVVYASIRPKSAVEAAVDDAQSA